MFVFVLVLLGSSLQPVYLNGAEVDDGDGVVEVALHKDEEEWEGERNWKVTTSSSELYKSGRAASSSNLNLNTPRLAFNLCTNRHKKTPTSAYPTSLPKQFYGDRILHSRAKNGRKHVNEQGNSHGVDCNGYHERHPVFVCDLDVRPPRMRKRTASLRVFDSQSDFARKTRFEARKTTCWVKKRRGWFSILGAIR